MNAEPENMPERPDEPEIILVSLEKTTFYLLKGEDHLNQLLLADGEFPKPVLCMNFNSLFDAKRVLGKRFNPGGSWGIHPEIVGRLRDTKCLTEIDT